jgi:hypothetical protein
MSGSDVRLPTSIYDPAATRRLLGDVTEVAVIEAGRYLRIRLTGPSGVDAGAHTSLDEQLNQVLRVSIESRLAALRAEDE